MTESEWENREREEKRRARRGWALDVALVVLALALVACLLWLVLGR